MWFGCQLFEIKRFDQQYGYVGVPTALNKDASDRQRTEFLYLSSIRFHMHDENFTILMLTRLPILLHHH